MQQTVYEDFKYSMQDVNRVYVGCKYTFREFLEQEDILFKFRLVLERYLLPGANPEDTLETYLYYLKPEDFAVKLLNRLKARIRVSVIETKKGPFAKGRRQYVTRQLTVEELTGFTPEQKESRGMVIQELSVSKLALASV